MARVKSAAVCLVIPPEPVGAFTLSGLLSGEPSYLPPFPPGDSYTGDG